MKKTVIIIFLCLIVAACGGKMSKKQSLDHTLYQYQKVMRWADYNTAMSFFAPDLAEDKKPTRLEVDRLRQFNISSYVAAPILPGEDENTIIQKVEMKLYNKHTKREKVVVDTQTWQYDKEVKRWWLVSGLPKIVQ